MILAWSFLRCLRVCVSLKFRCPSLYHYRHPFPILSGRTATSPCPVLQLEKTPPAFRLRLVLVVPRPALPYSDPPVLSPALPSPAQPCLACPALPCPALLLGYRGKGVGDPGKQISRPWSGRLNRRSDTIQGGTEPGVQKWIQRKCSSERDKSKDRVGLGRSSGAPARPHLLPTRVARSFSVRRPAGPT